MEEITHSWDSLLISNKGIWLIEIILGILVLILANFALKKGIKYFQRRGAISTYDWKEKADQIFYLPLHLLLWILGAAFVIDVLGHRFGFSAMLAYLEPVRNIGLILCLSWLLMRWKTEFHQTLVSKSQHGFRSIDPGTADIISKLLSIAIILISMMLILSIIGFNIIPLVAFGSIGAATLGFAGKDVIANFFGGTMLYITRPFVVGDLILLPERNLEGHVEEIGWYMTCIRDKEKRPVYLPNAIFSTMLVINGARLTHRRFDATIAVRYSDFSQIKPLVEAIRKLISTHPAIDKNLPIHVHFSAFGEYALNISIDAYCLATRQDEFLNVKQDLLLQIYEIMDSHGVQIPYPTSMLVYS